MSSAELPDASLDSMPQRPAEGDELDSVRALVQPRKAGQVGRYRILGKLGRGGMGIVYRAYDEQMGREVAIKVFTPQGQGSERARDILRFLREARSLARLRHPQVVTVHDFGQGDKFLYFVMELVTGQTLEFCLAHQMLTLRQNLKLLTQVARAVDYAHRHKVIHRDLKPGNIMVDEQGLPRVMDFGLAKFLGDAFSLSQTGTILGTAAYMSPEQARGDIHHIDEKSDIYSLGAILYEILTGVAPFEGSSFTEVLTRVVQEPVQPPRQRHPEVPPELELICLRALQKDQAQRYPQARDMAEELENFLQGRSHRRRQRRSTPWILCGLAVILLLAMGGGFFLLADPRALLNRSKPSFPTAAGKARRLIEEAMTLARQAGSEETARPLVSEALALSPNDWVVLQKAVEVYYRFSRLSSNLAQCKSLQEQGLECYHWAIQRHPQEYLARFYAYRIYAMQDNELHCARLLQEIRQLAGKKSDYGLWSQGMQYRQEAQNMRNPYQRDSIVQKALACFDDGLAAHPGFFWAYEGKALLLMVSGDPAALLATSNHLITSEPGMSQGYYWRATYFQQQQDYEQALRDYNQCLRLYPLCADAYCARGCIGYTQKQDHRAMTDFQEAVRIAPHYFLGYFHRGTLYFHLANFAAAQTDLDRAISLAPNYALAYHNRALLYAETGQPALALRDFDKAIELNPAYSHTLQLRGHLHFRQKNNAQAIADWEDVLRLQPDLESSLRPFLDQARRRNGK